MKAELDQLIALQKTESSIRRLQAEIKAIPQRRADIENEFEQRAFEVREVEKQLDEARQERARLEKEIAETQAKIERAERNLMTAKNETQYTAAIRETDASRKHISQLETQILEKMEIIEKADAVLKERAPEIERLRTECEAQLKSLEEQIEQQTIEIEEKKVEREQLYKGLSKNAGAVFNRISSRIKDGIAVVEVKNGACSACFMALRPQIFSEIRRGDEIILCESCNRILYYVPAEAAQV